MCDDSNFLITYLRDRIIVNISFFFQDPEIEINVIKTGKQKQNPQQDVDSDQHGDEDSDTEEDFAEIEN